MIRRPKASQREADSTVARLLDPAAYPHGPGSVEHIETHGHHVFLAGDRVYKLKKPVDLGFLDYSTPERRAHFCHEEVRLNRRLAPDVYLGVARVAIGRDGRVRIDGRGRTVDHVVVMRRLPAERMLPDLLAAGQATREMVQAIARRLAAFHRSAEVAPGRFGTPEAVAAQTVTNLDESLRIARGLVARKRLAWLRAWTVAELDRLAPVLAARHAAGRVRECHGDAHAANICVLTDGAIVFYDGIEFNDEFRFIDVAAELAFLAMDLVARGAPTLATAAVQAYVAASGDAGVEDVLRFYLVYRAAVRAKVAAIEWRGASALRRRALRERARVYFGLAEAYARDLVPPVLALMHGLPGSGKTTVARLLARTLGAERIASDVLRRPLVQRKSPERHQPEARLSIYGGAGVLARRRLAEFRSLIVDAGFRTRAQRRAVLDQVDTSRCRVALVETVAPRATLLERLAARQARGRDASEAGPDVLPIAEQEREPLDDSFPARRIDTTRPDLRAGIAELAAWLRQLPAPPMAAPA